MGSVTILFWPLFPIIYLIMFLGNMFGVTTGANVTEVALPYDQETGLVWTCDKTDYGWFDFTESRVEDDTQIFVFEARHEESYCNAVVFTAENGEELVYRARDVGPAFPIYGKVRLYAPDEYIIYDYVLPTENKVENGMWVKRGSGTQADDYFFGDTVVDGKEAFRVICFEDVEFSHSYDYGGWTEDGGYTTYQDIKVTYKYTKEKGLVIKEF